MTKYKGWFVVTLCGLLVAMQVIVSQHMELARYRAEQRVSDTAAKLGSEQIRDLMYELQQARTAEESEKTRWFVAGAVAASENPEHYREVWHAGYDRGQEVQRIADSLDKSAVFTNGK
jgi:hypothetical protein